MPPGSHNSDGRGGPGGRGGRGGNDAASGNYDDNFGMRAAAKSAIDSGLATPAGGKQAGGDGLGRSAGKASDNAISAFGPDRTASRQSRATAADRRGAINQEDMSQIADLDVTGLNAATQAARTVGGYTPSSFDDRRGMTSREMETRSYGDDAMSAARDAYQSVTPNGLLGMAAGLINPGLGIAANTALDVKQAADYSRAHGMKPDAWGATKTSLGRQAVGVVGGLLGGQALGRVGGMVGGRSGGMIGSLAGSKIGSSAAQSQYDRGISQPSTASYSGDAWGDQESFDVAAVDQSVSQVKPQGPVTGYSSSFGSYGTHNEAFTGLRNNFNRALSAWS